MPKNVHSSHSNTCTKAAHWIKGIHWLPGKATSDERSGGRRVCVSPLCFQQKLILPPQRMHSVIIDAQRWKYIFIDSQSHHQCLFWTTFSSYLFLHKTFPQQLPITAKWWWCFGKNDCLMPAVLLILVFVNIAAVSRRWLALQAGSCSFLLSSLALLSIISSLSLLL